MDKGEIDRVRTIDHLIVIDQFDQFFKKWQFQVLIAQTAHYRYRLTIDVIDYRLTINDVPIYRILPAFSFKKINEI